MKKNIFKPFLFLLVTLFIVSCNNDNVDRVFNESASERLTEAMNQYKNSLTSSEQGWVLQYYPDKNQKYGGHTFVVNFREDKTTDVYYELASDYTIPETSTYNIISNGGPVLTFNTYNSLMHLFATPSQDLYEAKGGDYEFLLMSEENDVIQLKGNKTGNNMELLKLNESPESYLAKVVDIRDYLNGASYLMTLNGKEVGVSSTERNFTFIEEGKEAVKIAYIYTDKGVKLYEPIILDGIEVRDFTLNKETNQLISLSGNVIIDILTSPVDMAQDWLIFSTIGNSDSFVSVYEQVKAQNTAVWGETLNNGMYFGNTTTRSTGTVPGIMLLSDGYVAQYLLNFSGILGQPNQLNINKVGGETNWSYYTHLEPLVDFIVNNAPYEVTVINDDAARFVSVANPNNYFTIVK